MTLVITSQEYQNADYFLGTAIYVIKLLKRNF